MEDALRRTNPFGHPREGLGFLANVLRSSPEMCLGTSWLAVDAGGGQHVGRGRRWDVWLGHAGMCGSPTWQRLGQHPRVRRAFQVPEGAGWAPWHMVIFYGAPMLRRWCTDGALMGCR